MTKKVDLRLDYDDCRDVPNGTLYRKGAVNQVWWSDDKPETWTAPTEQSAIDNFNCMVERWT